MAPGLPDRVDYAHLADDAVVVERVYPLRDMPRLRDLLADEQGSVRARFAFSNIASGRAGASVAVEAIPHLVCQRCLQGFAFAAAGNSEIEFSDGLEAGADGSRREAYATEGGWVSLRDLAEEELLLALPIVAMHPPHSCKEAPTYAAAEQIQEMSGDRTRPFAGLQDLLKKT